MSEVNKALKSGKSAVIAMGAQITTLMWLRTLTNHQYRFGTKLQDSMKILYKEGGVLRFYKGYIPSLIMGSLCRFGDVSIYKYIENKNKNKEFSRSQELILTSGLSMLWRINLMPLDTLDVMLQVNGKKGYSILKDKIKTNGVRVLYHGTTAWSVTNFIGNYGWFLTYSTIKDKYPNNNSLLFNGITGFLASTTSDILTNPIRIAKTTRQSYDIPISYTKIVRNIYNQYGLIEFWRRGLATRVITHGFQSSLFVVLWNYIENKLNNT